MFHFLTIQVECKVSSQRANYHLRGEPLLTRSIPLIKGVDEDIENLKKRFHEKEHEAIVLGTKMAVDRLNGRFHMPVDE